ncbi:MAG TPA: NAD(P)H-binding protein [Sphingobacteriaceae bacterium]
MDVTSGKTATLIGATGLIGSHLLDLLINDSYFSSVTLLVRRPLQIIHPKLCVKIVDFPDYKHLKDGITGSDMVFCAVGTTQKKVKGNKDAYRKVDFNIPVGAARACKETGVPQFLLVSAIGADSSSNSFYLKLKGEVEDALEQLNLPSVSVFRPSLLLGRKEEFRFGEKIGELLMSGLSFLIPSKYKPIQGRDVARAMLEASKAAPNGFNISHYREMMNT